MCLFACSDRSAALFSVADSYQLASSNQWYPIAPMFHVPEPGLGVVILRAAASLLSREKNTHKKRVHPSLPSSSLALSSAQWLP